MPFQARRNVSLDKRFILSLRLNPGIVVKLNIPEKKCGETVRKANESEKHSGERREIRIGETALYSVSRSFLWWISKQQNPA